MHSMNAQALAPILWQGRSGRLYSGTRESLDQFNLGENGFHLLLAGVRVLWVGSSAELVADPQSRHRFRHALATADNAIRLTEPGDDSARLSTLFDLEQGQPAPVTAAQAA